MNNLIVPIIPGWVMMILLIIAIGFVISMFSFLIAFIIKNEKLGNFSNKMAMISSMSLLSFLMIFITIFGYITISAKPYVITKTNNIIRVNSNSQWVKNTTYNILKHENGIYYLMDDGYDPTIIKITEVELEKMMNLHK